MAKQQKLNEEIMGNIASGNKMTHKLCRDVFNSFLAIGFAKVIE